MGSVIEALKSRGLWDDTVFVLVSDHGEEFGEHGGWQHDQSLYNELLRVPLLIHLPRGEHGGRRLEGAVSLLDVLPTLADILDRPELARGASGASLLPMLEGESAASEARVIGIRANRKKFYRPWKLLRGDLNVAVLSGPWKAIWNAEPDTIELYDLASDAEEQVNLAAAEPERAEALGRIARDGGRGCTPAGGEARERETEIDEATLERLRSLGYAD
jgi:arylsulfatase A-like enzyme